jgi:hypothetical protein
MSKQLESDTEKTFNVQPILLAFISLVLGGTAVWYAWLRYASLMSRIDTGWHEWIQPLMVVLFGLLSLWAAVLFMLHKPDGLSYFKLGLSIIPLILFVNLVILLLKAVAGILQGNAAFLLDRVLSQPHKFIMIPIVIIALILLGVLNNTEDQKTK